MKLGVYSIMQDEEDQVDRWCDFVDSIKPDKVVIVDGGSKDKTIEKLAERGYKVLKKKFGKSYADQRNYALSRLNTDWVLNIDADEVYSGMSRRILDELMTKAPKNVLGYSFPTVHLTQYNKDADPHIRLFRKMEGLEYKNATHETLHYNGVHVPMHPAHFETIGGYRVLYRDDIQLIHYAYMKSPDKLRKKAKRYIEQDQGNGIVISHENQFLGETKACFVLESTGVAGGAKVVMEMVNRLHNRGWDVDLFALEGQPGWFPLSVQVTQFRDYFELVEKLKDMPGAKIATWWKTAKVVAMCNGPLFYLVQDIETSYARTDEEAAAVLETYDMPLRPLCDAKWVADQLAQMGKQPILTGISINHDLFKDNVVDRDKTRLLYIERGNPLKNRELFKHAVDILVERGLQFSIVTLSEEPQEYGCPHIHLGRVEDDKLAEMYNQAGVYVSTSRHEGFCLPSLEAMACGCPVVTTHSQGNEEFCIDKDTCLMGDTAEDIADAITCIITGEWPQTMVDNAKRMAATYSWEKVIDRLEAALLGKTIREES